MHNILSFGKVNEQLLFDKFLMGFNTKTQKRKNFLPLRHKGTKEEIKESLTYKFHRSLRLKLRLSREFLRGRITKEEYFVINLFLFSVFSVFSVANLFIFFCGFCGFCAFCGKISSFFFVFFVA